MTGDSLPDGHRPPRWLFYAVALGLYLTLRGYHSFDGDQAYRLPLLLHWRDPGLFADDPFVQAFDAFNPHRGSFIVLDVVTRPLGLALGLFVVFVATFGATCMGVNRVACGSSPGGAADCRARWRLGWFWPQRPATSAPITCSRQWFSTD